MAEASSARTVREAVGVFHDVKSFQDAIEELTAAGFDRADLSLLAIDKAVEAKLGHAYRKVGDLEENAVAPRGAYVDDHSMAEARTGVIGGLAYIGAVAAAGVVVASGGGLAVAIAAAVAAGSGGGLLGSIGASFLGREKAESLQAQLDKGGLLLWVRVVDPPHEQRALEILATHNAEDVHIHDLPVSDDPDANPLSGINIDPFLPDAKI
jgi:hypothetical protein